ncbi:response regulator [Kamptonema animale CS-326]|uniref:response regulator n=1 Tax=Kamptonema animale TaxID=92934 RepID=UPI00232C16A0|nr:response regulator [Kamptonema animale]MDB9512430.1 response regulator [Kamptonema animale CS-326]
MDNNKLKILIVDDQPSNLRFLSKILTDQGYNVKRAISGQLGLNAALGSPPNLILLDIMMPDMDGYELCQKLKSMESTRSVPIIFLSGLDDVQYKIKAFQVGGVDYITKPFQVEEVLARIDTQIALQKLQNKLEEQNALLQQSQSLIASILNSSLDGIAAFATVRNKERKIVDFQWILVNHSVEAILALKSEELVGKYLLEEMPLHRKNGLFDLYVSVVETGEPLDTEFYYEQEKLSPCWLQIVAVKLNDGFAVTFHNITARKQAEEELARSNAELEQFAYVASHDLQAPLSTIASYAQLLEGRYRDQIDANAMKFIQKMIKGSVRMQSLIDDLLEYSRVSKKSKDFEATDCNQIFEEACGNLHLAIRKNQATVSRCDLPIVIGDCSQMVQVFQNLIGNAIKYRRDYPPIIHLSVERRETDWLFSVSDNGIGIDSKHSERIFQIFQRLHTQEEYTGTGIGLAICQKIVERHGGKIWVESQLGAGATFYFTLPYIKL